MFSLNDIKNLVAEKGNMGGIWTEVYAAPSSHFLSLSAKPSEEGDRDMASAGKLSVGSDTLLPGKQLFKIYTTQEKGSLKAARQGEVDGISHKITLSMFNPGLTSAGLGLLEIPNQNWIFFIRTGNQMFRLGNEAFPAKLDADGEVGTGDTSAALKGNSMNFSSYEVGFAGEVIDINRIIAMTTVADSGLTAAFVPAQGATGVLIDAVPTVTFSEAVVNADTLAAFTNTQITDVVSLKKYDVNGNFVSNKPFSAAIVGQVVTVTPTTDFDAASIYELKVDATKVLSADIKGIITGASSARFTTA